jgi:hypothetical protein
VVVVVLLVIILFVALVAQVQVVTEPAQSATLQALLLPLALVAQVQLLVAVTMAQKDLIAYVAHLHLQAVDSARQK